MPLPSRLPGRQRSAQKSSEPFDPSAFLAKVGAGRTLRHYRPKQAIFSQGEPADTVFYIHGGTAQLSVVSATAKKRSLPYSAPAISWARDASLRISPSALQQQLQLLSAQP